MFNIINIIQFNKATNFINDFFKHDISVDTKSSNPDDYLIYLNSQLIIWKDSPEDLIDHDNFNKLFDRRFNNKFMVYNLTNKNINFKSNIDKILDFQAPDYPSYLLEFLLTFSVSVKNWLSLDCYNVLIVFDTLKNVKITLLFFS